MSDTVDSLLLLTEMIKAGGDYNLGKEKIRSNERLELSLYDKKRQATQDSTNINITLAMLQEKDKELQADIKDSHARLTQANINVFDIINLPEQFQTASADEIANGIKENQLQDIYAQAEVGNEIGETFKNMRTANSYNQFILRQLDLIEGVIGTNKKLATHKTITAGDDMILKMDDFEAALQSPEFAESFVEEFGLGKAVSGYFSDDPTT